MKDIDEIGFDSAFEQALSIVKSDTTAFGISIDLDGIDPIDAPATGMHVQQGIKAKALLNQMHKLVDEKQFIGLEITEFDPHNDIKKRTEQLIINIIASTYSIKDDHMIGQENMLGSL